MASSRTSSGTRKLSEVARKLVVPSGIVSTGWPAVRDCCRYKLGVAFDPWQDGAGRVILAKRADGKLAVMIGGVGMSLPRQVGKTYLIGAIVFALCVLNPGLLVIWSAHHARTHGETFLAMQAFAERSKVKPYIRQVFTGSGDEEIRFLNGSRILFGARERGFGRGVPGVDVIVSDEAQIMSDKALDAQLATMNTSQFGLAIYVGTPPRPDDPSEAFTRMRTEAWAGTLQDAAWIEFGADADAKPDDRKQWAKANPSFPHRTPVESILRLQRKLKPESFLREGLGVWDDLEPEPEEFLSSRRWRELESAVGMESVAAFAVEVSADRMTAAIVAAGPVGDWHFAVELVPWSRGDDPCPPGVGWVLPRCVELAASHESAIFAVDAGGPAASLIEPMQRAGLSVRILTVNEVRAATAAFVDGVNDGSLLHGPQPELDTQVREAKTRPLGDGGQAISRKKSKVPVHGLIAATFAHLLARDRRTPEAYSLGDFEEQIWRERFEQGESVPAAWADRFKREQQGGNA